MVTSASGLWSPSYPLLGTFNHFWSFLVISSHLFSILIIVGHLNKGTHLMSLCHHWLFLDTFGHLQSSPLSMPWSFLSIFVTFYTYWQVIVDSSGAKEWTIYDAGPKTIKSPLIFLPPVSGTADVFFRQILTLSSLGFRVIAVSYSAFHVYIHIFQVDWSYW